jgi:hypothetical protein
VTYRPAGIVQGETSRAVPVNADVHDIEVIFVDEPDAIVNPLGIKGVGEIGIVGVAAAITNAVYHATGRRVRDLPPVNARTRFGSLQRNQRLPANNRTG